MHVYDKNKKETFASLIQHIMIVTFIILTSIEDKYIQNSNQSQGNNIV